MPPKNARRQNATPRDKRHENGLAAPGRQIKKSKSPPLPNGNATLAANRPSAVSSSVASSAGPFAPPPLAPSTSNQHLGECETDEKSTFLDPGLACSSGSSEFELDNQRADDPMANNHLHTQHPSSLQNASSASVDPSVAINDMDGAQASRDAGAFNNTTVIRLHTVRDIFAILFLLLQLPPLMLTVVQCCFALLTFGGPSNGLLSFSTLTPASDFVSASHGGNPSILTIAVFDVLAWICAWMLPTWWKDLTLDSAQAVVALSLGGGATGLGANLHCLLCMVMIVVNHIFRNRDYRQRGLDYLWILVSRLAQDKFDQLPATPIAREVFYPRRAWPRTLIELHIITQGIIRIVRRWVSRSDQAKSATIRDLNPDLPSSTSTLATTSSTAIDPAGEGGRNTSTDGRPPGPPPATREQREKSASSAKKRRKQATIVRSQQPFWAAIASTKVTVSKEIEQSQASRDAFEANSHSPYQLGDAADNCLEDRFWVSGMTDTEIFFTAITVPQDSFKTDTGANDSDFAERRPGVNAEFRVLLNRTNWSSVSCTVESLGEGRNRCIGRVYGLVPAMTYAVEFIEVHSGQIMLNTHLVTQPVSSSSDKSTSGVLSQPPKSLRPSSPKSTLKGLIAVQDLSLQDKRNGLRKSRRDHRSTLAVLKKDVDGNEDKLNNLGPNEEKARQRQVQLHREIQQIESQSSEILSGIEALSQVPDEERQSHTRSEATWRSSFDRRNAARTELDNTKSEVERDLANARADSAQIQQKRVKSVSRLDTLNAKHDSLVISNAQSSEQQARLMSERAAHLADLRSQEANLMRQLNNVENLRHGIEADTAAKEQMCLELEAALQSGGFNNAMAPQTPESTLGGLAPGVPPGLSQIPTQFAVGTPPPQSRRESVVHKNRGRSSSMLSSISNFTDNEIEQSGGQGQKANGFNPAESQADWTGYNGYGPLGQRGNLVMGSFPQRSSSGDEALQMHLGDSNHQASPPPRLNPIGSEVGRGSPKNNIGQRP